MPEQITFEVNGDLVVGLLYEPVGPTWGAVVTTGPLTSVKEQATGAYAQALAQHGLATLSFDHRHFGESGGAPRQYESPPRKAEDIQTAVGVLADRFPGLPIFAVGICAGGGYMAQAVADTPSIAAYAGVAGFYHDAAQSKEWMGDGYNTAIEAGRIARETFERTGEAEMIPAVAQDGDRAMPMDEAFAFYGTDRGGEATFPNYRNSFATMSREVTTPYDAQSAALDITQPMLMIHSENALVPMLARRFFDRLEGEKDQEWMQSEGQIDFYDDPKLIEPAAKRIADFFQAQTV